MEAVAVARRAIALGRVMRDGSVFQAAGPTPVRMSELFVPGTDTLVVYNSMFPRDRSDDRAAPRVGRTLLLLDLTPGGRPAGWDEQLNYD